MRPATQLGTLPQIATPFPYFLGQQYVGGVAPPRVGRPDDATTRYGSPSSTSADGETRPPTVSGRRQRSPAAARLW